MIITEERTLPYPSCLIAEVILDVENYPNFLPWCNKVEIIENLNDKIIADLTVSFKNMKGQYRSLVKSKQEQSNYTIDIQLIRGSLKRLHSYWHLTYLQPNETTVKFFVDLEFDSFILNQLLNLVSATAVAKIIDSFTKRVKLRYDKTI